MPFLGDIFIHLFDWAKDPQRQEKIINARLEAELDGVDAGLSAAAARLTVVESQVGAGPADNSVTNAKLSDMAAFTIKARDGGTTGDPSDLSIAALTEKTTLANADLFLIQDSAASNAFKKVQKSNLVTAASDTAAGVIEVADQAEMEAGSSTARAVTPGRQHSHPSAAKAWIYLNGTGTIATQSSYGITSVSDQGTGRYHVTFSTAFSSTATMCGVGSAGAASNTIGDRQLSIFPLTTTTAALNSGQTASVNMYDANLVMAAFFGDQ